ncbi:MAG: dipicolinate synthase subunit B, partial [Syntrophomonas sp.]
TIAKMANGIVDTPALMAIKAHLRNQRPVVIAISTNDALGINAKNLGLLLNMKNIFFVPFRQDNPQEKANSLVADMEQVVDTALYALQGKQIQPLILGAY